MHVVLEEDRRTKNKSDKAKKDRSLSFGIIDYFKRYLFILCQNLFLITIC